MNSLDNKSIIDAVKDGYTAQIAVDSDGIVNYYDMDKNMLNQLKHTGQVVINRNINVIGYRLKPVE